MVRLSHHIADYLVWIVWKERLLNPRHSGLTIVPSIQKIRFIRDTADLTSCMAAGINALTPICAPTSDLPTVHAATRSHSKRLFGQPPLVMAMLIGCLFLLRLPSALVARELNNPDESQMLSQAMKFMVDPRPWVAVDPTTSGPLNSYLISIFLFLGLKPGFVLVHMLANFLICFQVVLVYLTLRRIGYEINALWGAFVMVLLYGFATHTDYLIYASELLPTLLLMAGFYIFLVWLDEPAGLDSAGTRLFLLFSGGLVLGAAPWCKLQAGPIAGALGLVVMAAIFRRRGTVLTEFSRVKELIALSTGALLTTCVMLVVLVRTQALQDFWYSYIRGNLAYSASELTRSTLNVALIFCASPLREPVIVVLLCLLVALAATLRGNSRFFLRKERRWGSIGLLAYTCTAVLAISRSRYSFLHYTILLVPPVTCLAALWFCQLPETTSRADGRLFRGWRMCNYCLVLVLAAMAGARYATMIRAIHEQSRSEVNGSPRTPRVAFSVPNGDTAKVLDLLACPTCTRHWPVNDSNERIARVVSDIQESRRVRSLAIWGWAPGVYVLTGLVPATRDSIGQFPISRGPMEKYFRQRFVADLRANPPDVFIDAVAPDAFMWSWTENDGYESDPDLQTFIGSNYVLVDELTLVKGAKPVRFFARHESASKPN